MKTIYERLASATTEGDYDAYLVEGVGPDQARQVQEEFLQWYRHEMAGDFSRHDELAEELLGSKRIDGRFEEAKFLEEAQYSPRYLDSSTTIQNELRDSQEQEWEAAGIQDLEQMAMMLSGDIDSPEVEMKLHALHRLGRVDTTADDFLDYFRLPGKFSPTDREFMYDIAAGDFDDFETHLSKYVHRKTDETEGYNPTERNKRRVSQNVSDADINRQKVMDALSVKTYEQPRHSQRELSWTKKAAEVAESDNKNLFIVVGLSHLINSNESFTGKLQTAGFDVDPRTLKRFEGIS
jgi:hypothetical protein